MIRVILCLVVFWNVENYFDPFDDLLTLDDAFTQEGSYGWTWSRFIKKSNEIAKTLIACGIQEDGSWEAPCLVGLCEIENFFVLYRLTSDTPLAPLRYGIIHRDSPDPRGIDVALLYHRDRFVPVKTDFYPITEEDGSRVETREILYTSGVIDQKDTLHVMVNHWPSRLGGTSAQKHRMTASAILLRITDSLLRQSPGARILIMGDFNEQPGTPPMEQLTSGAMVNVSDRATYKYRGAWECIDQFLVSPAAEKEVEYVKTMRLPHLLERDRTHLGYKPRRTYQGPVYKGGISDHLPITLKFITFVSYGLTTR